MLEGRVLQVGVFKYQSWKEEKKRRRDSVYGQATKGAAEEEASIFYVEKDAGILWRGKYVPPRYTPARERMDNKGDGSNIYGL